MIWESWTNLIVLDILFEVFITCWVQIVSEDTTASLRRRDSEGAYPREDIGYDIFWLE